MYIQEWMDFLHIQAENIGIFMYCLCILRVPLCAVCYGLDFVWHYALLRKTHFVVVRVHVDDVHMHYGYACIQNGYAGRSQICRYVDKNAGTYRMPLVEERGNEQTYCTYMYIWSCIYKGIVIWDGWLWFWSVIKTIMTDYKGIYT
jgi:hypothetical protein